MELLWSQKWNTLPNNSNVNWNCSRVKSRRSYPKSLFFSFLLSFKRFINLSWYFISELLSCYIVYDYILKMLRLQRPRCEDWTPQGQTNVGEMVDLICLNVEDTCPLNMFLGQKNSSDSISPIFVYE